MKYMWHLTIWFRYFREYIQCVCVFMYLWQHTICSSSTIANQICGNVKCSPMLAKLSFHVFFFLNTLTEGKEMSLCKAYATWKMLYSFYFGFTKLWKRKKQRTFEAMLALSAEEIITSLKRAPFQIQQSVFLLKDRAHVVHSHSLFWSRRSHLQEIWI